jgi:hypothetical protein
MRTSFGRIRFRKYDWLLPEQARQVPIEWPEGAFATIPQCRLQHFSPSRQRRAAYLLTP